MPKTSSIDFGIIKEDESLTDFELMERMAKIEEKQKEIEKLREREELKKDPDATIKAYRAAHFICHPRCGFVVDRRDEASIIQHKSQCGYCIETREAKAREMEAIKDGNCKMRYILHSIENGKQEIENLKRKIQREEKEQQPNWQFVIKMSQSKIHELENHIFQEGIQKHKLLRHENEIVAQSAKALYDKYLSLTPQQRSRCQY
jgi:hypothetical protein